MLKLKKLQQFKDALIVYTLVEAIISSCTRRSFKVKEISYIHAEGYPAAEMKHGPLIDESMPVIVIAQNKVIMTKL
jgi:glucosamine 6-phosphate synthetase-like amidotransferase/phosphosugar isomerase protein